MPDPIRALKLVCLARIPHLRVLAWSGDQILASRGYTLLRSDPARDPHHWEEVAHFTPPSWRGLTSRTRLASRLFREGFHALAVCPSGQIVGAVPGAIVTLAPGATDFHVTHTIQRGTRPLFVTATPDGQVFWGEYFDNPERDEVHIYVSRDNGLTWKAAYTFPPKSIRHVHNVVYDRWENLLWILTGDLAAECRIIRATLDFGTVEVVLSGNQQTRAVAAVPAPDGLYFASDTPAEMNHIYRFSRAGQLARLSEVNSSVLSGCRAGDSLFFSTMAEPSTVNVDRRVCLYGSAEGTAWSRLLTWNKDLWPMRYFQYGNAFFPSGEAPSDLLALTTIAVKRDDLATTIFRIEPQP